MADFKEIKTQQEFDEAIKERLRREKEAVEAKYQGFSELNKENESLKSQISSLSELVKKSEEDSKTFNSKINELTEKIGEYELKDLKTTIALKKGIPYELASRLVGTDEASITADAESLSKMIGSREPVAPLKSTESKEVGSEQSLYADLLEAFNFTE